MTRIATTVMLLSLTVSMSFGAEDAVEQETLAAFVRELDPDVLTSSQAGPDGGPDEFRRMLGDDIRTRRQSVNAKDVEQWRALQSAADWERFQQSRVDALRESLGELPEPPEDLNVRVTRIIEGNGFEVECLVFESRPGLLVTANLYRPSQPHSSMPGLLICHSHHNPKTQGELQDMGMIWARAGCLVLVMDQIGHGERRQHPFRTAADYNGQFRVGRQDYYFRYNVGMQLHLIGESLIGWMVWDLMRGVDLLLDQPRVDPERIILMGAVAGGGDPCSVTAALDQHITAAVPFNFGGPQPENRFPLPDDAELSFNYVGGGSWESTRNLRLSAREGFLPWVIVGSIAPRPLIYAHEFSWDRERDPVWRRLQTIYRWLDAPDRLASVHGYGQVQDTSDEASHCNNIGAYHRKQMAPILERWYGIATPEPEDSDRLDETELLCVEGVESAGHIELPPIHRLADRIARERMALFREEINRRTDDQRRARLRTAWSDVLGLEPRQTARVLHTDLERQHPVRVVKYSLQVDRFTIPLLLLSPAEPKRHPCVVAVAQQGKAGFLKRRADKIAQLLSSGIAVCLPDLPGMGETSPGTYRGRRSASTTISSSRLMLGGTIIGDRLQDLLSLIDWLRTHGEIDGDRIAIWGDSFAPVNPPGRNIIVPLGVDHEPDHSEPLGGMLSLLAGLFDSRITAILSRGGLVSLRSLLDSQFVYVPHDAIIPGALTIGDLPDIAATIHPAAVRVEALVDGTNRRPLADVVHSDWEHVLEADNAVSVSVGPSDDSIDWILTSLRPNNAASND